MAIFEDYLLDGSVHKGLGRASGFIDRAEGALDADDRKTARRYAQRALDILANARPLINPHQTGAPAALGEIAQLEGDARELLADAASDVEEEQEGDDADIDDVVSAYVDGL